MARPFYTEAYATSLARLPLDLVRARELLFDLVWKDIRIRYRFAALGFLWAVLEPLLLMLVLTFVFSFVFDMDLGGRALGYGAGFDAVFILTGLLAWQFLSASLTAANASLVQGESLVTKVNFPREILPLATVGGALVNFGIGIVLLLILRTFLVGLPPATSVWAVPVFLIELMLVVGMALTLSTLNITYRDVAYMTTAALLFGFYATPVFYRPELVKDSLTERGVSWLYTLYNVNPMVGIISGYREALLFGRPPAASLMVWPLVVSLGVLAGGVVLFRRRAGILADQI
jgi:ABC-type polysaccharide/polyol phosphate export permease